MNNNCIFRKIIKEKKSKNIIYQNKTITAFNDINPQAPIHILIVPNICIPSLNHINKNNEHYIVHMFSAAIKIAKIKNINHSGYRLILNCNKHAGQEIKHIHLHLLGGKYLGPIVFNKK